MMLHDEHLVGAAVGYIRDELINAEWALRRAVDDIRGVFDSIEDEYLRERRSDVEFVFERVLRNLLGRDTGPLSPPPDAIVVAYDLSPADTAQLHKAAVAGLITDAGGKTSHTAIIARAHEIPAVVGLENITELVETDDLAADRRRRRHRDRQPDGGDGRAVPRRAAAPGRGRRGCCTRCATCRRARATTSTSSCYANIDGPDELDDALDYGAMGVGLFRTEYLFMGHAELPDEEKHYQTARRGARAARRPAGDDPHVRSRRRQARARSSRRRTSARRTRRSGCARSGCACRRLGRELFKSQLRGLLRASAHGPLKLMFPMISGVAELRAAQGRRSTRSSSSCATRASRSTSTSRSAS